MSPRLTDDRDEAQKTEGIVQLHRQDSNLVCLAVQGLKLCVTVLSLLTFSLCCARHSKVSREEGSGRDSQGSFLCIRV